MSNKKVPDPEAGRRCGDDREEEASGSFGSTTGDAASSAGASSPLAMSTENASELVGGGGASSTPISSAAAATNGIHDTTKLRVEAAGAPPTAPYGTNSATTSSAASASSSSDRRPTLEHSPPPQRHLLPAVPTNEAEFLHAHTVYGEKSWQVALLKFLHSNPVQITLMALLLLDVCVLFVELFLDAAIPACGIVVRDAISCCPATNSSSSSSGSDGEGGGAHRFLAGDGNGGGHHGVCAAPLVDSPQYEAGCDEHKYPALHPTHVALFSITVSILGIFLIELSLLMAAIGPRVFFRHFFYVLDLVIVTVSLTLELTFHFLDDDALAALTGILVLSRVWRFVRIGHGLIEVTVEATSHQKEDVLKYVEELEALLVDNGIALPPTRHKKQVKDSLSRTMLEDM